MPIRNKKDRELNPDLAELVRIGREMDKGREPVEENEESIKLIQDEIRKYRAEKRSHSLRKPR